MSQNNSTVFFGFSANNFICSLFALLFAVLFSNLALAEGNVAGVADPATVAAPAAPDATKPAPEAPVVAEPVTVSEKRRPINVRQLQAMEFGTFASDVSGGSIIISPGGARTVRGAISLLNRGSFGAAEFDISGHPGEMVTIFLPDRVTLNGGKGSAQATVSHLTMASGAVTLDAQGHARIKIGGTLDIPGSAAAGNYSGNFNIDVRYLR